MLAMANLRCEGLGSNLGAWRRAGLMQRKSSGFGHDKMLVLVASGYSTWWPREVRPGARADRPGMTRSVLRSMTVPVLMVH